METIKKREVIIRMDLIKDLDKALNNPKYKLSDKIIFVNHFLEKGDIEVIKSEEK